MAEGEAKGKVTKESIKRVSKGVYDINFKEYSRLTGYAWGAFVGAAGLAYLMTQILNLNRPAPAPSKGAGAEGEGPA